MHHVRAQAKVRQKYVVVRLTHQQLLEVDQRLRLGDGPDTHATAIIQNTAKAVLRGGSSDMKGDGTLVVK